MLKYLFAHKPWNFFFFEATKRPDRIHAQGNVVAVLDHLNLPGRGRCFHCGDA